MKIEVTDRSGVAHCVTGTSGETLMRALAQQDLVEATCGGACSCATCHVYIDAAWRDVLPAISVMESALLEGLINTQSASRLACQITLLPTHDGIKVTVAKE